MAKNQLVKILTSPTKEASSTYGINGILAKLFRTMLDDLNIGLSRWGSLMYDFIHDIRNAVPNNRKEQTSMRGNLTKELTRGEMTWKVFCKAMRFLQIVKIEIVIRAHHENGSKSEHSTWVNLGSRRENITVLLDEVDKPDNDAVNEDETETD